MKGYVLVNVNPFRQTPDFSTPIWEQIHHLADIHLTDAQKFVLPVYSIFLKNLQRTRTALAVKYPNCELIYIIQNISEQWEWWYTL